MALLASDGWEEADGGGFGHRQHQAFPGLSLAAPFVSWSCLAGEWLHPLPSYLNVNRKIPSTLWNVKWIKLWVAKWHSQILAPKSSLSLTQQASPSRLWLGQVFILPRVTVVTQDNAPAGASSWSQAYGPLPYEQLPSAQNILWPLPPLSRDCHPSRTQMMSLHLPEATLPQPSQLTVIITEHTHRSYASSLKFTKRWNPVFHSSFGSKMGPESP